MVILKSPRPEASLRIMPDNNRKAPPIPTAFIAVCANSGLTFTVSLNQSTALIPRSITFQEETLNLLMHLQLLPQFV